MNRKIVSYVGYAVKARKVLLGVDNIIQKKKSLVVLYDEKLSDNGKEKLLRNLEKTDTRVFVVDVEEIYPNHSCKAIGVTDVNLASAIINEMEVDLNE